MLAEFRLPAPHDRLSMVAVPAPRTGTQRQEDPEVCPLGELRFNERLCLKTEQMNE